MRITEAGFGLMNTKGRAWRKRDLSDLRRNSFELSRRCEQLRNTIGTYTSFHKTELAVR